MSRRRPVAALVALVVSVLTLLGSASGAAAHPLGNFTVNHYADVEVSSGVIRVTYVVDLAEIPSFQVRDELDADPEAWADDRIDEVLRSVALEVDDERLELIPVDRRLSRPEGQAGLTTTRLAVLLEARLPGSGDEEVHEGRFVDAGDEGRIGWREIVVDAAGDARIVRSDVPAEDLSDALRSYPEDRLASPLDVREASFSFVPGTVEVARTALDDGDGVGRAGDRFAGLLDRDDVTPVVLAGMLGVALLVGAGHALAPGHGKTVMAAYLIGTRGRPVDAVLLGVIVSVMHTASVLLLGLVLYQVDESFALDRIYPALTLVSGVGVLVVGVWLATTRARALRAVVDPDPDPDRDHGAPTSGTAAPVAVAVAVVERGAASPAVATIAPPDPDHDHGHPDHGHPDHGHHDHPDHDLGGHDHGHHHGPGGHSHDLPEGVAPLSRRGLVLLATAGGVVPSPSAVIVLVSAFTLGRVGLGLALVGAFSVGLAVTLTAVGLTLVFGSRAFGDRLSHRVVRIFPLVGGVALLVLGAVLVTQGATSL